MIRLEFRLTMPRRGSWNGGWSGANRDYLIFRNVSDKKFKELAFGDQLYKSWHYNWNDGWGACVAARIMQSGERRNKSNGFCGYEWMVNDILLYNEIRG